MKHTHLALLFVIVCAASASAQDWHSLKLPVNDDITGLTFLSPDTGFLVTRHGTLVVTLDGAKTWKTHRINAGALLEGVTFANGKLGLVCGKRGEVFRTTDGGVTWSRVSPGKDTLVIFYSVRLFDKDNGLVIGMSIAEDTPYEGIAYRTDNGGKTWQKLGHLGMGYSEIFYDPKLGAYFPSFGQFHHSSDKGKTWTTIKTTGKERARDIAFAGNSGLMAGPKGFCSVSHDGGKTWKSENQDPSLTFVAAALINDKEAYIAGLNSVMMHTADGGDNWKRELLSSSFDVLDMQRIGNRLYAVGTGGGIVYRNLK